MNKEASKYAIEYIQNQMAIDKKLEKCVSNPVISGVEVELSSLKKKSISVEELEELKGNAYVWRNIIPYLSDSALYHLSLKYLSEVKDVRLDSFTKPEELLLNNVLLEVLNRMSFYGRHLDEKKVKESAYRDALLESVDKASETGVIDEILSNPNYEIKTSNTPYNLGDSKGLRMVMKSNIELDTKSPFVKEDSNESKMVPLSDARLRRIPTEEFLNDIDSED